MLSIIRTGFIAGLVTIIVAPIIATVLRWVKSCITAIPCLNEGE